MRQSPNTGRFFPSWHEPLLWADILWVFWSFKLHPNLLPGQLGVYKVGLTATLSRKTYWVLSCILRTTQTWSLLEFFNLARKLQVWCDSVGIIEERWRQKQRQSRKGRCVCLGQNLFNSLLCLLFCLGRFGRVGWIHLSRNLSYNYSYTRAGTFGL